MKSILPAVVIATSGLLGLASFGAQAADGTITFTGSVSSTTCSINGAASGTPANVAVTLPAVTAGALATVGSTAGVTPIKLSLSGCTGPATKAIASFENGPTVDQATGYLINSGTAANVEVQLLNTSLTRINIPTNTNNQLATNGYGLNGGAGTITYSAQYYATGAATAGTVSTSVQYTMQYQ